MSRAKVLPNDSLIKPLSKFNDVEGESIVYTARRDIIQITLLSFFPYDGIEDEMEQNNDDLLLQFKSIKFLYLNLDII